MIVSILAAIFASWMISSIQTLIKLSKTFKSSLSGFGRSSVFSTILRYKRGAFIQDLAGRIVSISLSDTMQVFKHRIGTMSTGSSGHRSLRKKIFPRRGKRFHPENSDRRISPEVWTAACGSAVIVGLAAPRRRVAIRILAHIVGTCFLVLSAVGPTSASFSDPCNPVNPFYDQIRCELRNFDPGKLPPCQNYSLVIGSVLRYPDRPRPDEPDRLELCMARCLAVAMCAPPYSNFIEACRQLCCNGFRFVAGYGSSTSGGGVQFGF